MSAGIMKTICRVDEMERLSSPMRSATAGLAANDRMMPSPISSRKKLRGTSGRLSTTSWRSALGQHGLTISLCPPMG